MSGYSGNASFEFDLERWFDNETKQYIAYVLFEDETRFKYEIIKLQVEGRAYYTPGKFYGPPENCYPDEGEVEITSCVGPDGKDWEDQLTHSERDLLLEIITESVQEGLDGPDPDDYHDDHEDIPDDYYEPSED